MCKSYYYQIWACLGKKICHHNLLHWRYRKSKIWATFFKVSIQHETHFLKLFFRNNAATHWKICLAGQSPTLTCSFKPYIKLPAYIRTSCWSCWSAKSIRQTRFHEFHTNWKIQSKFCRFCHFISRLEITTNKKLNWIILGWKVSSIDLILLKSDNLNKKRIIASACFWPNEDHETHPTIYWSCSLLGQVNLVSIFIRTFCLVNVYLQNTDVFCVHPKRNNNLLKRPTQKAKTSSDSCPRNECNQNRESNSHVQLFPTLNFIGFHGSMMSFIQGRREMADVPVV